MTFFKRSIIALITAFLFFNQSPALSDETHELYHDEDRGVDYDYSKLCEIQTNLYSLITQSDWENIRHEKFTKGRERFNASGPYIEYTYDHNGIFIKLDDKAQSKPNPNNIDLLKIDKKILPIDLLNKKYLISTLDIKNLHESAKDLSLWCDAVLIKFNFSGDAISNIELYMSPGVD